MGILTELNFELTQEHDSRANTHVFADKEWNGHILKSVQ